MRIIANGTLREFREKHADARGPLEAWHSEAGAGDWDGPQDIKRRYARASFVGDNRVVFDSGGNKYRLVVKMNYFYKMAYIRFIGHRPQWPCFGSAEPPPSSVPGYDPPPPPRPGHPAGKPDLINKSGILIARVAISNVKFDFNKLAPMSACPVSLFSHARSDGLPKFRVNPPDQGLSPGHGRQILRQRGEDNLASRIEHACADHKAFLAGHGRIAFAHESFYLRAGVVHSGIHPVNRLHPPETPIAAGNPYPFPD